MAQNHAHDVDENGVRHVAAPDWPGLYRGLGRCHALDRGLQMTLMRILGQGRASEILEASDALLDVDVFFRRMNWRGQREASRLSDRAARACEAYCEGVNSVLSDKPPWELRLKGHRPGPWIIDDILLISRMAGYLALSQSQGEMERLLVEWVQAGVSRDRLEELFPGHLGDLDEDLLRAVTLGERIVPQELFALSPAPRMMTSNNWVISGTKTASGAPLLANDPHLEVNRLPNVWYEVVLEGPDGAVMGATIPGLPGVIIGRNANLSWGATYSFMDSVDSWIERCREGACLRGNDQWVPFRVRKETILRRKKPSVEQVFYENEHGVLDGDPHREGQYLATRWSGSAAGAASVSAFVELLEARNVREGRECLGRIETAWSWVLADRDGDIGFQMSGLMPRRREGASGLVPLPGWNPENDWNGFVDPGDLPRNLNPERGFFVTANHDLNGEGNASPINLPMASYRAERIERLLRDATSLRADDMTRIQLDLTSLQAEIFMRILNPLLPDTPQGRILSAWDFGYGTDSKGAFLFERF